MVMNHLNHIELVIYMCCRAVHQSFSSTAHRKMVLGTESVDSLSLKKKFGSTSSISTGVTDATSSYPLKKSSPTSNYTESAYRSDYSPSNDSFYSQTTRSESTKFNLSGNPSARNGRSNRMEKEEPDTPSLSSFRAPSNGKVAYRKDLKGRGSGRRHDTTASEATTMTCSTCPTESTVSYDQTGTEYSRESRGTSYTGSTVTEPSTARSSGTVTETDTVMDEGSSIYEQPRKSSELLTSPARRRAPVYHSGSDSFLEEDDKDYLQGNLSPMGRLNGYPPQVPPRPPPPTRPKPPRDPPPPVPLHLRSVPNFNVYPESSQSQDSLMDLTSRMDPSRSMGNLDYPVSSSNNDWRPPNLSSFRKRS